jgi:hypothetical protein
LRAAAQIAALAYGQTARNFAVERLSSLTAIQWVTRGYLLALAHMLPLNGWCPTIGSLVRHGLPTTTGLSTNKINEVTNYGKLRLCCRIRRQT